MDGGGGGGLKVGRVAVNMPTSCVALFLLRILLIKDFL